MVSSRALDLQSEMSAQLSHSIWAGGASSYHSHDLHSGYREEFRKIAHAVEIVLAHSRR